MRVSRFASESGQASTELLGMIFWLFMVALCAWQLCLAAWTVNQTSNAARTASRVAARGGDWRKATRNALSTPLRRQVAAVKLDGETATVKVKIPIVVPGVTTRRVTATRSATLPR